MATSTVATSTVATGTVMLAVTVLSACSIELTTTVHGSGVAGSELRLLSGFSRVAVSGGLDCAIEVGGATTIVSVQGDDNLLELVESEVRGDELRIRVRAGHHLDPMPRIEIHLPALERLELEGSGRARVQGLVGDRFILSQTGSGNVTVQGRVERLEVSRTGSGDVDLSALSAAQVDVRSTGSGYTYVDARERLDVDCTGSGDVIYRGRPTVSARTRGSGDVRRVGD